MTISKTARHAGYLPPSKSQPWVIDGISFTTKNALRDRCRVITAKHALGDRVVDPSDHAFLMGLLARHPDVARRTGSGVDYFEVFSPPPYFANKATRIRRTDGTLIDAGWGASIDGGWPWLDFTSACRHAVAEQIVDFKRAAFAAGPVTCALSGVALSPETCDVDHAHPLTFDALLDAYVDGRDWSVVPLVDHPSGTAKVFADPGVSARFAKWHQEHAVLRLVDARVNRANGNRAPKATP